MPCNKRGGYIQHPVWVHISAEEAREMNATGPREAVYIKATKEWVIGLCEICNGIEDIVSQHQRRLHRNDKKGLEIIAEHLARLRTTLQVYDQCRATEAPVFRRSRRGRK